MEFWKLVSAAFSLPGAKDSRIELCDWVSSQQLARLDRHSALN